VGHGCRWDRGNVLKSCSFIELSAVAEHHGFLKVLLRGLVNDDIMECGCPSTVKFTFFIIFLYQLLLLLFLLSAVGVSLVERVQHLLGGVCIKLRSESKRPILMAVVWGVLYLIR
jgi:hypothetical protein